MWKLADAAAAPPPAAARDQVQSASGVATLMDIRREDGYDGKHKAIEKYLSQPEVGGSPPAPLN